jgi:hypothetical protein
MTRNTPPAEFGLEIETPSNGRLRQSTVFALDANSSPIGTEKGDLASSDGRTKVATGLSRTLRAKGFRASAAGVRKKLEAAWDDTVAQHRRLREQGEKGSPEAAPPAAEGKKTQADLLVQLVEKAGVELFHAPG